MIINSISNSPLFNGSLDNSVVEYLNTTKNNYLRSIHNPQKIENINNKVSNTIDTLKDIMQKSFHKDTVLKIKEYDDKEHALYLESKFLKFNDFNSIHYIFFIRKNLLPSIILNFNWCKRVLEGVHSEKFWCTRFVCNLKNWRNLDNYDTAIYKARQYIDDINSAGMLNKKSFEEINTKLIEEESLNL